MKRRPANQKITRGQMKEYEVEWRKHNKWLKQSHQPKLTLDEFIAKVKGKKYKPEFKEATTPVFISGRDLRTHREKYPSLKGSAPTAMSGRKKENPKYTGSLIKGIATMHKSNAVPIADPQHAIDIARMAK